MTVAVHGVCEPGFEPVADALARTFSDQGELGAAVAAHVDGRLAVDVWGGTADLSSGASWREDTIAHVCGPARRRGAAVGARHAAR